MVGRRWEACSSWVPVSLLISHASLDRLKKAYTNDMHYFPIKRILKKGDITGLGIEHVVSEMWGVLLVPSSSPTLSPIHDGLDVNATCNMLVGGFTSTMTWFHAESINYPSTEGTPLQVVLIVVV